jgi:hypothetical protein
LQSFRRTLRVVADAGSELPPGLDWNRLSREMTGNIRVGLAAGECVGNYPAKARFFRLHWNGVMAAAALTGVFLLGFWLNIPAPQANHLWSSLGRITGHITHAPAPGSHDMLLASQQGIEVKANGTSLSYVPRDTGAVLVSVSTQGSVSARAMDDDTGQTTITEVYDAR